MNAHVPDIDRCRKLKDAGFPLGTEFIWAYILGEYRVHHFYNSTELPEEGHPAYPAPIVTELVEEIRNLKSGSMELHYKLHFLEGWNWNIHLTYPAAVHIKADTLPNALADLWLWARKEGRGG